MALHHHTAQPSHTIEGVKVVNVGIHVCQTYLGFRLHGEHGHWLMWLPNFNTSGILTMVMTSGSW